MSLPSDATDFARQLGAAAARTVKEAVDYSPVAKGGLAGAALGAGVGGLADWWNKDKGEDDSIWDGVLGGAAVGGLGGAGLGLGATAYNQGVTHDGQGVGGMIDDAKRLFGTEVAERPTNLQKTLGGAVGKNQLNQAEHIRRAINKWMQSDPRAVGDPQGMRQEMSQVAKPFLGRRPGPQSTRGVGKHSPGTAGHEWVEALYEPGGNDAVPWKFGN